MRRPLADSDKSGLSMFDLYKITWTVEQHITYWTSRG